jgi:hypothetical protein
MINNTETGEKTKLDPGAMVVWLVVISALLLVACSPSAGYRGPTDSRAIRTAVVDHRLVIERGDGGLIYESLESFVELRDQGVTIVVDGVCWSACALLLASYFADSVCWTADSSFRLHGAVSAAGAAAELRTNANILAVMDEPFRAVLPPAERWHERVWFVYSGGELHALLGRGQCSDQAA